MSITAGRNCSRTSWARASARRLGIRSAPTRIWTFTFKSGSSVSAVTAPMRTPLSRTAVPAAMPPALSVMA